MHHCGYCSEPVSLSTLSNHFCLRTYKSVDVNIFNQVFEHEAKDDVYEALAAHNYGNAQDEWSSILVGFMEINRKIITDDPVGEIEERRLNEHWSGLSDKIDPCCNMSHVELKQIVSEWVARTRVKFEVIKTADNTPSPIKLLNLFFNDGEKRLLHLLSLIEEFTMKVGDDECLF